MSNISAINLSTAAQSDVRAPALTAGGLPQPTDAHRPAMAAPVQNPTGNTRPPSSVDVYTPAPVSLEPSATRSAALAMFPQADRNHDGVVTLAEFFASFSLGGVGDMPSPSTKTPTGSVTAATSASSTKD